MRTSRVTAAEGGRKSDEWAGRDGGRGVRRQGGEEAGGDGCRGGTEAGGGGGRGERRQGRDGGSTKTNGEEFVSVSSTLYKIYAFYK